MAEIAPRIMASRSPRLEPSPMWAITAGALGRSWRKRGRARSWLPLADDLDDGATAGRPPQVLLGDPDPDAAHRETAEDRLGDGGGERLEQMEAALLHDLAHGAVQMVVVDGVGQLVARLGVIVQREQLEVDVQALPGLFLERARAVMAEHGQTFESDDGQRFLSGRGGGGRSRRGAG